MNLVPVGMTKSIFRTALVVKKHSPNLLFVGGLGGIVTSTVLACRATLKLADELPNMRADLEAVKTHTQDPDEQAKSVAMVYAINTGRVAKLYAPALVVGTVSVGALTGSHVQLTRRNAGLTAAYAAMATAYDEYRAKVISQIGVDKESELYTGRTVKEVKVGDTKRKEVDLSLPNGASPYGVMFNEQTSTSWHTQGELNRMFVCVQETYANNRLNRRGYVFLNEVYDALGMERTKAGQIVGWVKKNDHGDSYIDFGLLTPESEKFMIGWEKDVWLDFNVDGNILDLI